MGSGEGKDGRDGGVGFSIGLVMNVPDYIRNCIILGEVECCRIYRMTITIILADAVNTAS